MRIKSMMGIIALITCFTSISNTAYAQRQKPLNQEITLSTGYLEPFDKDFSGDITFNILYNRYFSNGLGIRTGLQYTPTIAKLDHTFGVPLAVSYRWNKRGDLMEDGFRNAKKSGETGGSLKNGLFNFLLGLNRGTEFHLGLTPGYVAASKSGLKVSTDPQIKTERYTENGSPFFLSLDGGMAFHYPIGRVSLNINPAFHYVLTDTYKVHTVTTDMISGQSQAADRYVRWLFSVCGGLSFSF